MRALQRDGRSATQVCWRRVSLDEAFHRVSEHALHCVEQALPTLMQPFHLTSRTLIQIVVFPSTQTPMGHRMWLELLENSCQVRRSLSARAKNFRPTKNGGRAESRTLHHWMSRSQQISCWIK